MKTRLSLILVLIFFIRQHALAQSPMNELKKYTGTWKAAVTMWMMPSDPPMVDTLVVQNEMMMNDLFFTSKYSGTMMMMNYEAVRTIGYDVVKKKFTSTFIDDMNSGIDYKEGIANGKTIELLGTKPDPITGKNLSTRDLITFMDASHMNIQQFEMLDGNERKTLEINLTKQ